MTLFTGQRRRGRGIETDRDESDKEEEETRLEKNLQGLDKGREIHDQDSKAQVHAGAVVVDGRPIQSLLHEAVSKGD